MSTRGRPSKAARVDEDSRRRIAQSLDETFFVEAGAGAGKTASLVERVCALVERGTPITSIAAITFTDAAAGELRERVRLELENRAEEGRPFCAAALDDVDDAPLSTLHAFAQQILSTHAIAAGLPPVLELLDDVDSRIAFDTAWASFFDGLASDPALVPTFGAAMVLGLDERHLRALAWEFHDNWHLLRDVSFAPTGFAGAPAPPVDAAALADLADAAVAMSSGCSVDDDKLRLHLVEVVMPFATRLRDALATGEPLAVLEAVQGSGSLTCGNGRKDQWKGPSKQDVIDRLDAVEAERRSLLRAVRTELFALACEDVRTFVLGRVSERRRLGRLEFHDLLVLARDLLAERRDVLERARASYDHLLIDEFQDTDPLQVDLALLLGREGAEAVPGRLFFVGDPKQSIYRFRHADIGMYSKVRGDFRSDVVPLAKNFRSVAPIIRWINRVFGHLLTSDEGQAPWAELVAVREGRGDSGPPIVTFGGPTEERASIGALREREAADIVEIITRAIDDPWLVADRRGGEEHWRPARLDDIAILLPTRTALPAIERALDAAHIPSRIESRSLVWSTQEARDLLAILRAIDDPSDQVALVAALRTPALACSDRDLVDAVDAKVRWERPDLDLLPDDAPVAVAIRTLDALRSLRWELPFTALVERVVRDLRLLEIATVGPRRRESWNRTRFVVDQARGFADRTPGASLRSFVEWADRQAEERARAMETVVPESDHLAVRITTVHAAKGREFPIVVVAGLSVEGEPNRDARVVWGGEDGPEIKVGAQDLEWRTAGYPDAKDADDLLDHQEAARLLYVACTRARDHLAVSLHHRSEGRGSLAARLHESCAAVRMVTDLAGLPPMLPIAPDPPRDLTPEPIDLAEWRVGRQVVLAAATAPSTWSATRIAGAFASAHAVAVAAGAGAHGDGEGEGGAGGVTGGSGTARGRAVHWVLEQVDLASGDPRVDELAARAAVVEGLVGREGEIAALVRSVLVSGTVAEAVAAPQRWKELYVGAPVGDTVVEGYIDLLYERADGLVVVDYKTDAVDESSGTDALLGRYELQLASYAVALEAVAPDRPVVEARLVVARQGAAIELVVDGARLREGMATVRASVRAVS